MKIACVQFDIAWENPHANYGDVRSLLGAASLPPGSLALLPEMFSTGFSMNVMPLTMIQLAKPSRCWPTGRAGWGSISLAALSLAEPDGRGLE